MLGGLVGGTVVSARVVGGWLTRAALEVVGELEAVLDVLAAVDVVASVTVVDGWLDEVGAFADGVEDPQAVANRRTATATTANRTCLPIAHTPRGHPRGLGGTVARERARRRRDLAARHSSWMGPRREDVAVGWLRPGWTVGLHPVRLGASLGALYGLIVGMVVGLVVGLMVYPPTAWFAVFEAGIPASVLGLLLGLVAGLLVASWRRVTRAGR